LSEYEDVQPQLIETQIESEAMSNNFQEIQQVVKIKQLGFNQQKLINKHITWKREHEQWKILKIENILEEKSELPKPQQMFCALIQSMLPTGVTFMPF
jgi:hypothetical protein